MSATDDQQRVVELCQAVVDRCRVQPHLDDFLLWQAGTLEHWLHVVLSGVGQEVGWAARTAVPYVTECPAPTTVGNEEWADGAVVWPDGLGALVEVQAVPMRAALARTIEQVPGELAALLAADWAATLQRAPDATTDPSWWRERRVIRRVWGLQLTLVHGDRHPMKDTSPHVRSGINKGLAALDRRVARTNPPWLRQVEACFEKPLLAAPIDTADGAAVLLAWASPIASSA